MPFAGNESFGAILEIGGASGARLFASAEGIAKSEILILSNLRALFRLKIITLKTFIISAL